MESPGSQEGYIVRSEEILKFLDTFVINEQKVFSFSSFKFQILFLNEEEVDESDAFWSTSTEIKGYDIYILYGLSAEKQRMRMFHELLEIDLNEQGISSDESHPIVQAEEEKFFGKRIE